jgi:trans-2,3-dihydro-3-hydroxyanthranilate isomerase
MQIPFYFVDVFAQEPLTGNPLSIVPGAEKLGEAEMKRIANEFNQAETTFILPGRQAVADWSLRSFTAAGYEVFGAGHNALGAWWWLAESGKLQLTDGVNHFSQEIGGSILPVEVLLRAEKVVSVTMTQSPPEFGNICKDTAALAASLGLEEADLMPESFPAQVVSTGAPHLLVPVRSRDAVSRSQPNPQQLAEVLEGVGGEGCYVFCLDPIDPSSAAHARFFNPTVGIIEDSATGTAAGPLACQLIAKGYSKDYETLRIEQGYKMHRPSLLTLQVRDGIVRLSGSCVTVASGTLFLKEHAVR